MRYSEETVQEVIERNNIVDVIGQVVKLKRSGSSYVGLCPFHHEKTPSFNVSEGKQLYYCFGCHAGGSVITFMMQYYHFTFQEAVEALAERAGIPIQGIKESPRQKKADDKRSKLLEINKKAAEFYYYKLKTPSGKKGYDYLRGRGLTDETIRHFGLGYADAYGDTLYKYMKKQGYSDELLKESGLFLFDEKKGFSDKFWNRVMFPIMDARSRVIGFGGRVMGDGKPKYLNSPESYLFNKRKHLYALNYARATRLPYFILCEGYMDVITMHQNGFTNAVASLGTALTEEQAQLISRFTKEVYLLYDSDGAGTMAAMRAAPILRGAGISSRVVRFEPHKDPDEFLKTEGKEAFQKRIDAAQNSFLFSCDQLKKEYNFSDPAEMTRFQHELARRLTTFTEEMERDNYIRACAGRYNLDADALRKMVLSEFARGTQAEHYQRPKSGKKSVSEEKEKGLLTSQKMLLAYLANYPEAYPQVKNLIRPEDYPDELVRTIAGKLYGQLEENELNIAALISSFDDSETQSEAARIFHTEVKVDNQGELDRAFTETVEKVLTESNNQMIHSGKSFDRESYQRFMSRKQLTEEIRSGKKKFHLVFEKSK